MNRKSPIIEPAALTPAPLDLLRPAAEQILAVLKSAILTMQLEPGRMISENEVGQIFGASRTPVREAFAQLRDDGLILTLPSRGTYVAKLSERQIRGAQFLREALEVAVVERLSAEGLSEAVRDALAANLASQQSAVEQGDTAAFQALDDRFHATLASATGFDRVGALLIREKAALDRLRILALNDSAHMTRLLSEHQGIFDAVSSGSTGQAADRMRRHLRSVLQTLSGLVQANRDYFEPTEG